MSGAALAGLTVLVTRPQAQAEGLCAALTAEGASVRRLPAITVEPLADVAATRVALQGLDGTDILIFLSVNAVREALALMPTLVASATRAEVYAVGAASVAALLRAGIAARAPETPSSEGLLALPALASGAVRGRRVGLVSGTGGRPVLAETLAARGARVSAVAVYRRVRPAFDAHEINTRIGAATPQVLVATSGETLENLAAMLQVAGRPELLEVPLLVIAERLRACARSSGFFGPIRVASAADDGEIAASLVSWADELRMARR